MQYSYSGVFMRSGDLRVDLAVSGDAAFGELVQLDELILVRDNGSRGKALDYDTAALGAREEFRKVAGKSEHPTLRTAHDQPTHLNSMCPGGVCIIAGSGPSLDTEFVQAAQAKGVPVIVLGNAVKKIPRASYWVAHQHPFAYSPEVHERHDTVTLAPWRMADMPMWNFANDTAMRQTLRQTVGTLFYEEQSIDSLAFFEAPRMTDFGFPCSFMYALSFATLLGFDNIILTGVDMGGTLDKFYAFKRIPPAEDMARKTLIYREIVEKFSEWHAPFIARAIRLCAVGSTPFKIPVYNPQTLLGKSLAKMTQLSSQLANCKVFKHQASANLKARYAHVRSRLTAVRLAPQHLYGKRDLLVAAAPAVFDVPIVNGAYASLAKMAGVKCPECLKKRTLVPVYNLLVKSIEREEPGVHEAWAQAVPGRWAIFIDLGNRILFRSDKQEEAAAYEEVKL